MVYLFKSLKTRDFNGMLLDSKTCFKLNFLLATALLIKLDCKAYFGY